MKTNMGAKDRVTRLLLATVIFTFIYFTRTINPTVLVIGLLLALVFIITGIIGFCPLYQLFGIGTCHKKIKHDTRN